MDTNDFISLIQPMLNDERVVDFRIVGGKFIARAVPLHFPGGPVPDDWRAEGTEPLMVVSELLAKFANTPRDFYWVDEEEGDEPFDPVVDGFKLN